MKFAFATCVQLGLSCIEKIYEIGGKLDLLITLHDHKASKKSGRIYLDEFSSVQGIPLLKINHINDDEVVDILKKEQIDWLFIIGWSQIANERLISAPLKGALGMHPTLLPEGRGRAAIPWAIIKGLPKTGVTMFKLDSGVDTGPILAQFEIVLNEDSDATRLYEKVNEAHKNLIARAWPALKDGTIQLVEQDEQLATYWEGRKPEDGRLLANMAVVEADRLVRATTKPYPGAFFTTDNSKVIVWKASFTHELSTTACQFQLKDGLLTALEYDIVPLT